MGNWPLISTVLPLNHRQGHDNKGNDHQFKKLLIGKQILCLFTFAFSSLQIVLIVK